MHGSDSRLKMLLKKAKAMDTSAIEICMMRFSTPSIDGGMLGGFAQIAKAA